MEEHYRLLERLYAKAPTNEYYKPELRIEEGKSTLTIEIRPEFLHAAAAVHGSVYFKALDDAAFFAANSVVPDVFVLTAQFNLYLMRPVVSGRLTATGTLINQSSRVLIADSVLHDDQGRQLARGSGTFMPTTISLHELDEKS